MSTHARKTPAAIAASILCLVANRGFADDDASGSGPAPTPPAALKPGPAKPSLQAGVPVDHGGTGRKVGVVGEHELSAAEQEKLPTAGFWSHFSAGLVATVFPTPPVEGAEIRNGVVRVTERKVASAGLGLIAALGPDWRVVRRTFDDEPWSLYSLKGFGFYTGVSFKPDEIIDTVAVGGELHYVLKQGGVRLCVGIGLAPRAKYLAADFTENADAPMGAQAVSFINTAALGVQIGVAFVPGWD